MENEANGIRKCFKRNSCKDRVMKRIFLLAKNYLWGISWYHCISEMQNPQQNLNKEGLIAFDKELRCPLWTQAEKHF